MPAAKNWVIVAGDFARTGGQDRANYELAWHLAEREECWVHLVAHFVAEPLASHPLVRYVKVVRPRGRHLLGSIFLDRVGRRVAREVCASAPDTRVVVNGGNCRWSDVAWVHMVHEAFTPHDRHAPWTFRLKNRFTLWRSRRAERRVFSRSRTVIANSFKTRDEVVTHYGVSPE